MKPSGWTRRNKVLLSLLLPVLLIVIVILGRLSGAEPLPAHPSIEAAETAYIQMKLDLSRRILEYVLTDTGSSVEDQVAAEQRLAIQDWLFYRNYDSATARLQHADSLRVKQSATWQALSRIARESGHYSEAQAAATRAIETAESESERLASQILLAHAIHDQAIQNRRQGKEPDGRLLNEAHSTLTAVLAQEPGQPTASKLLLGISLLRRDGPTALKAWRYYFFIPSQEAATGLLEGPGKTLDRVLPQWPGRDLSPDELESLVLALAQSRFFDYAAIVATDLQAQPEYRIESHPALQETLFYADFVSRIKHITEDYYRQIALGKAKENILSLFTGNLLLEKSYQDSLWREARHLWEQLAFTGERPQFDQASFLAEISKRFGAEVTMGSSGNYSGFVLFMGHRIVDDTVVIEQYGHRAEFRFVVLESMVSNCYSGWFWDGRQAPGGWGLKSTIVQVREVYLDEPFEVWKMVTDPQERSKTEKRIAQETALDDTLARANPYAYLPGLKRRLQFDAAQRLYESLSAKGYEGTELCIAFVAEFLRLKMESLVIAHEGRHVIDELDYPIQYKLWTDEREFRAKLSQVVFTSDPKFTIASGGILDRNIGSNSQHGKANERIIKIIVTWMEKHTDEIAGIDTTRPLLPQFDRLSPDQIRALFAAADPMAANTPR